MPTYSAKGYPSAVTLRSNRTLLVEGVGDKRAIARLVIELRNQDKLSFDNLVIDTAEDIPNASGGNRERVEAMHHVVGGSHKFAALVDREFRDFDLVIPEDRSPIHRVVPDYLFWTRGHSIENYFSTSRIIKASLEQHHPEHLPTDYSRILSDALPGILRACAAVSLAGLHIGKLDRIREIKDMDNWRVLADGTVRLEMPNLQATLVSRGLNATESSAFATAWQNYIPKLEAEDVSLSQWICHGHLADAHIWSAVAALLRHYGMDATAADRVARGKKEDRFKTSSEKWSQECVSGVGECPVELIKWICT